MEEEFDLGDELLDSNKGVVDGKRPVFLTVLCILTFVGAGFGILWALWQLIAYGVMENTMSTLVDPNVDMPDEFLNTYRWLKFSQYLSVAGNILCLAGALFMWHLRKMGFFLYLVGQIAPLVGTFLSYSSMFNGMDFQGIGIGLMIAYMIIPTGFVIMYGVNYKYLVK